MVGWEEPVEGDAADAEFDFEDDDDDFEEDDDQGDHVFDDHVGSERAALLEVESSVKRGQHGELSAHSAGSSETALLASRRSRGVRSKQMGLSPDLGGDLRMHERHTPRTRGGRQQQARAGEVVGVGSASRFARTSDAAAAAEADANAALYIGRAAGGPEGHAPGLNCRCDQYACSCKRSCACRLLGDDGAQTAPAPGSPAAAAAAAAGPSGPFGRGNASIVQSRLLESHGGIAPPSRMREAAYLFRCDCGFTIDATDSQFDSLACGCEPEKCTCRRKCTCDGLPRGE